MVADRLVLYVAHPLAPTDAEMQAIGRPSNGATVHTLGHLALWANVDRATRWLAWLRRSFPETTFIAPWIATVTSLKGDDSPAVREAGLVDDCAVVERCDGIVLCGGRISSGMRREMDHGRLRPSGVGLLGNPLRIWKLIAPSLPEPPDAHPAPTRAFVEWATPYERTGEAAP